MLAILTARTEANAESFRRMCDRTEACWVHLETPGDEAPDFYPNAFFFETRGEI